MPASRSEAPLPRALGAEAEAEKFSFPFRKNMPAQNKKCRENFSARLGRRHRRRAAGWSDWIFLGIFDKISSSEIVNILTYFS